MMTTICLVDKDDNILGYTDIPDDCGVVRYGGSYFVHDPTGVGWLCPGFKQVSMLTTDRLREKK